MTPRMLLTALVTTMATGLSATPLAFTPLSGTNESCYVVLDNGQTGYFSNETFDLTGQTTAFFNRSAYLPPAYGGYAWQIGDLSQDAISLIANGDSFGRSSVRAGVSFKFRTSLPRVDITAEGTFTYNNYMDSTRIYLRDRTLISMMYDRQNWTGSETVRVSIDPNHEFDVYATTNHNNIYQGTFSANHPMRAAITIRPATNFLVGQLTLQDVVPNPMADRLVDWKVYQGGAPIATGVFPSMGFGGFQLGVSDIYSGPATVVFDTNTHLRRVVPVVLGEMTVQVGGVSMVNGDVDSSGEVDAVDIDIVIADFGGTAWGAVTDVDLSGEVDAVDIDIVIANFGAVDE